MGGGGRNSIWMENKHFWYLMHSTAIIIPVFYMIKFLKGVSIGVVILKLGLVIGNFLKEAIFELLALCDVFKCI